MNKALEIKNVKIGEGIPKICTSIIGRSLIEILEEAEVIKETSADIVEWRVDFYEHYDNLKEVINALSKVSNIIPDKPLIFTFRSKAEGGENEITSETYFKLNRAAAESGYADIIDVELFNEEENIRSLIHFAHEKAVSVIVSNHDFKKTPEKCEIIKRILKAWDLGADIPKIAVMPQNTLDVITLLDASIIVKEEYGNGPVITMSMAGKGLISRLSGEIFGSDVTFGAAKKASAPGQISVKDLRNIINLIHDNLYI
ncbi:MAG: type I 3-dehydroquinate dehydratase [Solirubrobacterales bacterium]